MAEPHPRGGEAPARRACRRGLVDPVAAGDAREALDVALAEPARQQEKHDFAHSETHPASNAKKKRFADLILALKFAVGLGVALAAFQALRLALH